MEKFGNLPGGPIVRWNMYQEKIVDGKSIGVTDPDGNFHRFEKGESLSLVQIPEVPGERVPVITEQDGTKKLFETWASGKKE
jgi:hypothetical protein